MQQVAVVRPDETVDMRKVKTDERVGSLWVITEGLKPGERVVVEGGDRVRAGQKVRRGGEHRLRPRRRRSRRDHGQVLHQPAHRRDGDLHPHGDHRRRGDGAAAHRALSEHRAAGDSADRPLPGRRRGDARAVGGHADRAADERRRQDALHVLAQPDRRQPDAAAGGLRRHHRPEHRPGAHQPALLAGRLPAAARRGEPGRHRQQVRDQPAGALRAVLAQGHVRLAVPRQLRVRQHQRPDDARARHRPGADLRRLAVRHPALGQSRHAGQARHHRQRDRQRAAGAEHRQPGRPARRRSGAPRPGVHLHGAGAGAPGRAWRSSRTSWSGPSRTARSSG